MAAVFNNAKVRNIGVDLTPIYQATTKSIVIGCLLTNKGSGYLPVHVVQRDTSAVDTALAPRTGVKGGAGFDAALGKKIVLLPGEALMASCPVAGAFDAFISVLEGIA